MYFFFLRVARAFLTSVTSLPVLFQGFLLCVPFRTHARSSFCPSNVVASQPKRFQVDSSCSHWYSESNEPICI